MVRVQKEPLLAALLTLSLVAGIPIASGQNNIVAIDADHKLDSQAAVDEFESEGVVRRNLTRLDMELAVSTKHEEVNISGFHTDFNHKFVCVDYRENIQRTVRIFLRDDYFYPRINTGLDSATSETTASIEPTRERNYTAMTMTFNGAERACFKLSREAGIYFSTKSKGYQVLNDSTNFEIPRLAGSSEQWQYVETMEFQNSTASINTSNESLTMQYDADSDQATETWLPVPECKDPSEQPVCQYQKDGEPEKVYLMTTADNPPTVRYKVGHDPVSDVQSWASDLKRVWGGWADSISGLFGGDSSGN